MDSRNGVHCLRLLAILKHPTSDFRHLTRNWGVGCKIYMAIIPAMFLAMIETCVNVAEFKDKLTEYLAKAEAGEQIVVCRRNVPVVRLQRIARTIRPNRSTLGSMRGTVQVLGDLTEPFIPENEWEMFK